MDDSPSIPKPGWRLHLEGDEFDLEDWRHSLNDPFDPVAELLPDGKTVLRSQQFEGLLDAGEVRSRGQVLVSRLNGAIALWNGARPIRGGAVLRIDDEGLQHQWMFAESVLIEARDKVWGAVVTSLGPDGLPVPKPPPEPSGPQSWNLLADCNDDVSDLLDHFGRADNWIDIYKTIEFAEALVGGEHKLRRLLGDTGKDAKALKSWANFFRHAKTHRPSRAFTLQEAKPLLSFTVRKVLQSLTG